jgi:uncharacterized protein YceK
MKILSILFVTTLLSGCGTIDTIKHWIPSPWDDNQSAKIIDVRQSIHQLDCKQPHLPQVSRINDNIQWFELYATSKGWRQQDMLRLIKPMQETANEFHKRSQEKQGSDMYCELKKQLLLQQSALAASAVLGRF